MTASAGASVIAQMLAGYGVTHVFFVDAVLRRTLIALEGLGVRRVLAHSEKAAMCMADGDARASGRVGVCFAQSVGAADLAAAAATSLGARGLTDTRDPLSVGTVGGYAAPPANEIVHAADCTRPTARGRLARLVVPGRDRRQMRLPRPDGALLLRQRRDPLPPARTRDRAPPRPRLVLVINNNSGFGRGLPIVRRLRGNRPGNAEELIRFGPTDFARVAEAFGVRGIRVEHPAAIAPALAAALDHSGPVVVDVATGIATRAPGPWIPEVQR